MDRKEHTMDRRAFVKGAAAASAAGFAFGPGLFDGGRAGAQGVRADGAVPGARPNILVIKVDQLRFPRVFPAGINNADEFLQHVMPNLHQLWRSGVKFTNHYAAASACTPSRGTIITGLYSQQSWLVQTILAKPGTQLSYQPWLNPAYPTYGKLLRAAGYRTPYVGKWHVSIPRQETPRLEPYGFEGVSYYDPTGANLQGAYGDHADGYLNDEDIAAQGVGWLEQHGASGAPWCLTVSFINPHDKEFFWAGTEFQTYNELFDAHPKYQPFTNYSTPDNPPVVPWDVNALKSPPPLGYPAVPPNWESESQIAANKPSTQTFSRLFQELVWGGATDDPSRQEFTVEAYPPAPHTQVGSYGLAKAPFSYWQRSLDSYAQAMSLADEQIGTVLAAFAGLPAAVRNNTVIVFMSDHGEYAGAHGFLSGKVGSLYDEAYHVPLIVVDPSGRFTGDVDIPRQGLTSTVDLLPLLVSLGHGGSRDWLSGDLGTIYGRRHDLLSMLRSAHAPGRQYVLLATDEGVPGFFNFNGSPTHLVGVRTPELKFGLYANWRGVTAQIANDDTLETELYDYSTEAGRAEVNNLKADPRIATLKQTLLTELIPRELRAPLPGALGVAQTVSKDAYLAYAALVRNLPAPGSNGSSAEKLRALLAFGRDF
ncbi:sulfatase family protein [Gemmatimonadetes bacterium T265]|nr:sulfatase family protein [Gemmatimonadetes bacterium T265]